MEARELAQRVADAVEARFCAAVGAPVITRTDKSVRIVMTAQGMIPADEIFVTVTAPGLEDPRRWALSVGYRPPFETTVYSFVLYAGPKEFPRTLTHAVSAMIDHMERSF